MGLFQLGRGTAKAGGFAGRYGAGLLETNAAPISGPTGTYGGTALPKAILINTANGTLYMNEGTKASPYWTPVNYIQNGLNACATDWRDGVGIAIADTTASVTVAGSGVRIFGSGKPQTDSGVTVSFAQAGPPVASFIASATGSTAVIAASLGSTPALWTPTANGTLVIDADVAMSSALTLRRFFIGFIGTCADALVSPLTGSTVTITQVQADVQGLFMDSGLTAATELFAPHNKASEAGTIATTATGVDTSTVMPAAGTYVRLRVEITSTGIMKCFADKVQIASIAAAATAATAVVPVLLLTSTSAATKTMLVKRLAMWSQR
jgi:hypothetical protein